VNVLRVRLVVAVVTLLAVTACGSKTDTAPPVAKPVVTFSKTRVPQGSPVEIKFRFEVARQRRVSGRTTGCSSTSWTRTRADVDRRPQSSGSDVPVEARAGCRVHAHVVHSRVPVRGSVARDRRIVRARHQRTPATCGGSPGPARVPGRHASAAAQFDGVLVVFKDGWHPAEAAPDNPAAEWQWTRKESTLSFRNPRQNATLFLHYDGQPAMVDSPQTVSVQLHGEVVDTFQVTSPREEIRRIRLKAAQFGNDDLVEIRLVLDKTFVPALSGGASRDPGSWASASITPTWSRSKTLSSRPAFASVQSRLRAV